MNKNLPVTSILLTMLIFSGCATHKPKVRKGPKTYDQSVEDEFSSIENSQKDVLNYYRELRQKNWQQYKSEGKRKKVPYRVWRRQNPAPRSQKRPQASPEKLAPVPQAKPLAASIVKEMKIEIRQYMSYFCMENRKSARFSGSADCTAFTENVLRECENDHPVITDRSLVSCVKGKLK